jgi:hypothetical protein
MKIKLEVAATDLPHPKTSKYGSLYSVKYGGQGNTNKTRTVRQLKYLCATLRCGWVLGMDSTGFSKLFCLLPILHIGTTFTSVFNDYKDCLFVEGSGSVKIITCPDPGGPKKFGSGSGTLPVPDTKI